MNTNIARLPSAVALVAALALSLGACASPWANGGGATAQSSGTATGPRVTTAGSIPAGPAPGESAQADGIVAKGESSAELFEARNIRLVRNGADELAAQFELYNGSTATSSPSRWSDPKSRRFLLFDLPRGTSYQALSESSDAGYKGTWGRLSGNWTDTVAPGQSITLTAVFSAPPAETTTLLAALGDLLPAQVPIQGAGSPALKSDPILFDHHHDPNAGPLVCAAAKQGGPTEFRLPADVLFAFDSATLSPAAQIALDSLVKQVNGTSGTVSVAGNTDAIGSDAYNQTLSEQRAAAVADALKQRLGGKFSYGSVGFGKTKPVAPNTNPDGSDNPDGRAQNRHVDVEVTTTNPTPPAQPEINSATVQADLKTTVLSVRRSGGYLMTTLQVSNPDNAPGAFAYTNFVAADSAESGLFPGELAVQDTTGKTNGSLCIPGGTPNTYFSYAASMNNYTAIPAGATLTLWGLTPAPPADTTTVNVQIGGFPQPFPSQITPGP